MKIIREYTIQVQPYHSDIVGRIIFNNAAGEREESALHSLSEINNIIQLWKMNALCGSFALNTKLADNAVMYLEQR